ncbi:hypothetical protein AGLY_016833 [Aphis glycines]|uniref:Uncharacterized protein n=1 Tax=Aphis glycines TaxID=307491 RepID=A0A6G0SX00_APHGL|nr:hypothetical protein AGLY_016833 [Aphis glycines]
MMGMIKCKDHRLIDEQKKKNITVAPSYGLRDIKAKCYCTFSNSCPNLQQQLQGHLVSPSRRQLDVNKRRTTIYKGARRPATADVQKLSTTEHFHGTQPLILCYMRQTVKGYHQQGRLDHSSSLITPEEKTIQFNVAESIRQDDNINEHRIIVIDCKTYQMSVGAIYGEHRYISFGSS